MYLPCFADNRDERQAYRRIRSSLFTTAFPFSTLIKGVFDDRLDIVGNAWIHVDVGVGGLWMGFKSWWGPAASIRKSRGTVLQFGWDPLLRLKMPISMRTTSDTAKTTIAIPAITPALMIRLAAARARIAPDGLEGRRLTAIVSRYDSRLVVGKWSVQRVGADQAISYIRLNWAEGIPLCSMKRRHSH
jgi:hypothetical protein